MVSVEKLNIYLAKYTARLDKRSVRTGIIVLYFVCEHVKKGMAVRGEVW